MTSEAVGPRRTDPDPSPLTLPLDVPDPERPAPALSGRAPACPVVLPTGDRAWLVRTHADNRTVMSDPRFSRAAAAAAGAPRARNIPLDAASITTMDPPEHTRMRRIVGGAFNPRRLERLREGVRATARTLVDDVAARVMTGEPADLVAGLARPLALSVIADLLGLPEEDRADFRRWCDAYLRSAPDEAAAAREAAERLDDYFTELVRARREEPGEDLFGELISARDEDLLDDAELHTFAVTLLVAGYETVAAQLACSLVVLLRQGPPVSRFLDGEGLRPGVLEELLRFTPVAVTGGTIRVATADVELSGVRIRRGEAVLPALGAANRDPAVFPEPDRFDPERRERPGAAPHLAFGYGPHRCLGAHLARVELATALEELLTRLPGLRPATPLDDLRWDLSKPLRCPRTLPVLDGTGAGAPGTPKEKST
ncbi:cytochrome P450 [Nocardiopsis alba]|uniref:cytochrome P450 n=1 Tax=Nocardiopsis alba TaxID=53437 RepID=UPI0033E31496